MNIEDVKALNHLINIEGWIIRLLKSREDQVKFQKKKMIYINQVLHQEFHMGLLKSIIVLVITCLFVKFRKNLPCSSEISKLQKINEVNFPQISRINMRFLFNHMWQALKDHTRVRITQKQSVNINKFNKHNSRTPTLRWLLWLFVVIIIIIIIINH